MVLLNNQFIDLTGQRFGRLTVLKKEKSDNNGNVMWRCQCDCGNIVIVRGVSLRSGNTRSCGCLHKDIVRQKRGIPNVNARKHNEYLFFDDYVVGFTKQHTPFVIDKEDYEKIQEHRWVDSYDGYIFTVVNIGNKKYKTIFLHRLITNCSHDKVVDHINHDKTDNRNSNLRICTRQENNMNRRIAKNNISNVTGVYFNEQSKKWIAYIMVNKEQKYLGIYENIEDAIAARKKAQEEIFQLFEYNPDNDVINSIPFAQYLLKEGISNGKTEKKAKTE